MILIVLVEYTDVNLALSTWVHTSLSVVCIILRQGIMLQANVILIALGKSPVELSGLRPGPHQLRIAHNKDGCGYRRELLISFNIDNTPDNPHNNI